MLRNQRLGRGPNDEAVDERINALLLIEVGEGGGDGFGTAVMIFAAGRM